MKNPVRLSSQDLEHLIFTIESSQKIRKRSQFFLWSQGALQGCMPHETLLCAHGDIARMNFRFEVFSGGLLDARAEQAVSDPVNGLLPSLMDDWLRGGGLPRLYHLDGDGQVGRRRLMADLKRNGFGHVVTHGTRDIQGGHGSFFVFVRLPQPPCERSAYLAELLLPHLHLSLHRMLAQDQPGKHEADAEVMLLSKREIQVLHWVKNGKTNQEIAQILHISASTVKNHLQNIMRKLDVTNRAQAVGKSATLRLLVHGEAV